MKFFPGCIDHNVQDRCYSLTDLFLEMVYVIDSNLIDPVFDIAPQEKVPIQLSGKASARDALAFKTQCGGTPSYWKIRSGMFFMIGYA